MKKEITITEDKIKEILEVKFPEWFEKELTSDYGNPLKDAVEEVIKEKDGIIKTFVRERLVDILQDKEFSKKVTKDIISRIIQKGLRED